MTDEPTLRERVAASRAAQGLPPTITDPAAIERVAAVLLAHEKSPVPAATGRGMKTHVTKQIPNVSGTSERTSEEALK